MSSDINNSSNSSSSRFNAKAIEILKKLAKDVKQGKSITEDQAISVLRQVDGVNGSEVDDFVKSNDEVALYREILYGDLSSITNPKLKRNLQTIQTRLREVPLNFFTTEKEQENTAIEEALRLSDTPAIRSFSREDTDFSNEEANKILFSNGLSRLRKAGELYTVNSIIPKEKHGEKTNPEIIREMLRERWGSEDPDQSLSIRELDEIRRWGEKNYKDKADFYRDFSEQLAKSIKEDTRFSYEFLLQQFIEGRGSRHFKDKDFSNFFDEVCKSIGNALIKEKGYSTKGMALAVYDGTMEGTYDKVLMRVGNDGKAELLSAYSPFGNVKKITYEFNYDTSVDKAPKSKPDIPPSNIKLNLPKDLERFREYLEGCHAILSYNLTDPNVPPLRYNRDVFDYYILKPFQEIIRDERARGNKERFLSQEFIEKLALSTTENFKITPSDISRLQISFEDMDKKKLGNYDTRLKLGACLKYFYDHIKEDNLVIRSSQPVDSEQAISQMLSEFNDDEKVQSLVLLVNNGNWHFEVDKDKSKASIKYEAPWYSNMLYGDPYYNTVAEFDIKDNKLSPQTNVDRNYLEIIGMRRALSLATFRKYGSLVNGLDVRQMLYYLPGKEMTVERPKDNQLVLKFRGIELGRVTVSNGRGDIDFNLANIEKAVKIYGPSHGHAVPEKHSIIYDDW